MTKSMIAPIVAVVALAVGAIFGVTITEDVQTQIVEVVVGACAVGTAIHGIFKNHK